MNDVVYRVVINVGYNKAYFEFEGSEDAAAFARVALKHMVSSDDTKKRPYITMKIVDPAAEEREED